MNITQFDLNLLKLIHEIFYFPPIDGIMKFISFLGNGGFVWIVTALFLLIFKKTRRMGAAVSLALIFSLVVGNILMKPIIARVRPFDFDLSVVPLIKPPTDFSFPSGHTLSSFAAAGALLFCNKKAGIPAMVLASLIAFSRLYLLVHYPTDVLAGIIIGIILGYIAKKKSFVQ